VDLREDRPGEGTGALARICGMPALARTLLVLERKGYGRALLLVHPDDRALVQRTLERTGRALPELTWVEDEGLALAPLRDAAGDAAALLYWPGALTFGRLAPELVTRTPPAGGALVGEGGAPALLSPGALARGAGLPVQRALAGLAAGADELELEPELEPIWLRGPDDARRAEEALLISLRKPEDGVVARYDRHVSLAISRRMMGLDLHPNWITLCAGLVGVACGLLAAHGGYFWLLAGALLFQLNSILDGIDGEVARAKLLESRAGQWLDTITDDTSNLFFTVGAAVGCYQTWGSPVYLVLGAITGFGFVLTAVLEYHYLITVAKSGDLNRFRMPWEEEQEADTPAAPPRGMAAVLERLRFIVRRDTFVFITTIFAVLGQLRVMIWFFALGASIVWVSILVYRVLLPLLRRGTGAA
jgi:phosphatidylglycerophosphate synthase